ncbi:hypothetical protein BJV82DRAFT_202860 [Fennellomyces sp. T-0311]|nr:hypothetical protein BJV82DRAFT_202860 [Fennellomyces sp. T-0311]
MPPVVKLARQLYMQRMDELKRAIKEDDDKFMQLVGELEEIRSGKWDAKLASQVPAQQLPQQQSSTQQPPEQDQKQPINTEKDTQNDQKPVESAVIPEVVPTEEKNLTPVLPENEPISIDVREPEISLVAAAPEEATPEQALQAEPHITTVPVISETAIEPRPETPAMSTSPQSDTSYQSALETAMSSVYPADGPIEQPQEAIEEQDASHVEGEKRKVDDSEMEEEPASKRQRVEEPTKETKYQSKSQEQFDEAQREQASEPKSPEAINTKSPEAPLSVSADAEGNESVTGSESNAPTPTSSSDKRRSKDEQRQQKSWQKNINLLWREIANHKNGAMFMNPIKEATAPLYYDVVRHPMDLKTIKNRIRDGVT